MLSLMWILSEVSPPSLSSTTPRPQHTGVLRNPLSGSTHGRTCTVDNRGSIIGVGVAGYPYPYYTQNYSIGSGGQGSQGGRSDVAMHAQDGCRIPPIWSTLYLGKARHDGELGDGVRDLSSGLDHCVDAVLGKVINFVGILERNGTDRLGARGTNNHVLCARQEQKQSKRQKFSPAVERLMEILHPARHQHVAERPFVSLTQITCMFSHLS
jgi:hypothetical protein